MTYFRVPTPIVKWLILVTVSSLAVHLGSRFVNKNSFVVSKLPSVQSVSSLAVHLASRFVNKNSLVGSKLPSVVKHFDEPAYQKALEHHVLDDTLCSPVLGIKVRKNKL